MKTFQAKEVNNVYDHELLRYLVRYSNDEIKRGRLKPEEKKSVLRYWMRINGIKEKLND